MRRSISRIIAGLAADAPDRVVVEAPDGTLTASELDRRSNAFARVLIAAGVRRDDLVTVSLPNSAELVVAVCAIWKAGATPQPVLPGLDDGEFAAVVALARPALVIRDRSADRARPDGLAPALPGVSTDADDGPLPDLWARSWKAPTSSGSTGRPKVVLAAGPALLDPTVPVSPFLPLGAVQLVSGPLVHSAVFTYAFRGLMTGHRLVVLPRFDERAWVDAVARHGVTWTLLVPTMMHRILRLPDADRPAAALATIESVLHLGAPCAPELKRAFMAWIGPERVVEVYVGSESNGLTMIRGDEWLAHPGSVGRPLPGTTVAVRRDDGSPCAPGEVGLIWMRRDGAATYRYLGGTSRRDDDGWDTLGDLGSVDADGYLFVADRADDMIRRGGVGVHPVDVERVAEQHPAVRGAVAVGVPDEELGQAIVVVVDVGDATAAAEDVLAFVRSHVPAERRPTRVVVVHEPVRSDTGKVRRRAWAEWVAAGPH